MVATGEKQTIHSPSASESVKDFSQRKSFPGTVGGSFEIFVTASNAVEDVPGPLFLSLLTLLALLPNLSNLVLGVGLLTFFLADWGLISLLPRYKISYGPAKPQAALLALLRLPFAFLPDAWFWVIQVFGSSLVVYGFWIEPQWLRVRRESFETTKLGYDESVRILQIGDLHMDRVRGLDLKLLRAAENLQPDIIVFTGDTLSYSSVNDPVAWSSANRVFRSLRAPLGVYAVPGSPPVDPDHVLREVYKDTKVRLLRDETVPVSVGGSEIELIGISCSHKPFVDAPKLQEQAREPSDNFRILLYHSPDLAPNAATFDIDLQLSGHTHGGQVRLPMFGAIYTSSLYGKKFESGRRMIGDTAVYVTRGLGLEGAGAPRVRFLCRPEITLWELRGVPESSKGLR